MLILFFLLLTLLVVICTGIAGICWYFAGRMLKRTSGSSKANILVMAVDDESITLQKTKNTERAGIFGITGDDGQAVVGPVLSSDENSVTREIVKISGQFPAQTKVAWNTTLYGGRLRADLELPVREVLVSGKPGELPAWFVPGTADTWAILVHGATGTREQGLRVLHPLADVGLPILMITFRNDDGAPTSTDGLSHFGASEWEDLEAGVRYALGQGAQNVILYGWSMGGTIVKLFLARSVYANKICAVVLDAPVLDWVAALRSLTRKNRLPAFFASLTERIVRMRTGVKFANLAQEVQGQCSLPTLLFHGTADTTAPIAVSDSFVTVHPEVEYVRVAEAEHTQSWNVQSEMYGVKLRVFLHEHLVRSGEG